MEIEQLTSIFEAVKVLPLRPSDFLVVRTNRRLSAEQAAHLHAWFEDETGHTRIIILDGGADVDVLRLEPEPGLAEPVPAPASQQILPNGQPKKSTVPGGIA